MIDIQAKQFFSLTLYNELFKSTSTIIILSHHFLESHFISQYMQVLKLLRQKCNEIQQLPRRVIIKLVTKFNSIDQFMKAKRKSLKYFKIPIILINCGAQFKLTRLLNSFMTPVFHQAFGQSTGSGQLSLNQYIQWKKSLNLQPKEKLFYLMGQNIQKSPSPFLHNLAFKQLQLDHCFKFVNYQANSIGECNLKLNENTTMGATLTIPFKQQILTYLDSMSRGQIGSMNTVCTYQGYKHGDSFDWVGIFNPLARVGIQRSSKILILGAGGTAYATVYALIRLGIEKINIWNRTFDKAEKLRQFYCNKVQINVINIQNSGEYQLDFDVLINTIPSYSQIPTFLTQMNDDDKLKFKNRRLILLESSYSKQITNLNAFFKNIKEGGQQVEYINGYQMLGEVACCVFESLTGRVIYKRRKLLQQFKSYISNQ